MGSYNFNDISFGELPFTPSMFKHARNGKTFKIWYEVKHSEIARRKEAFATYASEQGMQAVVRTQRYNELFNELKEKFPDLKDDAQIAGIHSDERKKQEKEFQDRAKEITIAVAKENDKRMIDLMADVIIGAIKTIEFSDGKSSAGPISRDDTIEFLTSIPSSVASDIVIAIAFEKYDQEAVGK